MHVGEHVAIALDPAEGSKDGDEDSEPRSFAVCGQRSQRDVIVLKGAAGQLNEGARMGNVVDVGSPQAIEQRMGRRRQHG